MSDTLYDLFDVPIASGEVVGVRVSVRVPTRSGGVVTRQVTVNAPPSATQGDVIDAAFGYAEFAIANGVWSVDYEAEIDVAWIDQVVIGGIESPGVTL